MAISKLLIKNLFVSSRRSKELSRDGRVVHSSSFGPFKLKVVPIPVPAVPTRIPHIPADIIFCIIVYLWDDLKALQACIATSRVWREAAQPYLFRSVAITNEFRLRQLEEYLDNSTVASWIRDLDIDRCTQSHCRSYANEPFTDCTTRFFSIAPQLAEKLSSLTTLHLSHITNEMGCKITAELVQGLSSFQQVHTFNLTDCHLWDPVLFAFISAFPNITDLYLRNHHRVGEHYSGMVFLHSPRLISLRIDIPVNPYDMITPVLRWLETTPSVDTLRMVSIRNVAGTLRIPDDSGVCITAHVGRFLQKCTALEHIGLTFVGKNPATRDDIDDDLLQHIDLVHNPCLRSVELQDSDHACLVLSLLSKVAVCPDIRKISIVVSARPTFSDVYFVNHGAIATRLRGAEFAAVDEVHLVGPPRGFEETLRRSYGPLFKAGIAKFVSDFDSYHNSWKLCIA